MKAITLHAPFATLCVTRQPCDHPLMTFREDVPTRLECRGEQHPMVMRFETRSWPCPPSIIGQRVAIHQGKKRPKDVWRDFRDEREFPPTLAQFYDYYDRLVQIDESSDGEWWRYRWAGPFGCIVGTATITASLPIVDGSRPTGPHWEPRSIPCVSDDGDGRLTHWWHHDGGFRDISDQRPYGDWTPGRYAWLIEDAAPTTERCPWCNGSGKSIENHPYHGWLARMTCPACRGRGRCDPIPATGRPGWWHWEPTS